MRVEELRLNNWLLLDNKPKKVLWFKYGKVCVMNEYPSAIVDLERMQPIELTEEILLKCKGIVKLNEFQYKLYDWFIIERYSEKELWEIRKCLTEEGSILLCFIEYLHTFQNIVKALTNKELEIEL